jgi:alpha-glucosidase (family GH31 glycosyl hydrolase)
MVPRYASGIWWSRWFDVNNKDVLDIAEAYDSNRIPLDVFVIDMDWHTKDAWGGWTFDSHLFPFPADSMESLGALGLPVTLNTHDAQVRVCVRSCVCTHAVSDVLRAACSGSSLN